jgi:hypothetical protein
MMSCDLINGGFYDVQCFINNDIELFMGLIALIYNITQGAYGNEACHLVFLTQRYPHLVNQINVMILAV